MSRNLNRRLDRLEAIEQPPLRQRCVFLRKGEPIPEPDPGEQLIIIRWIWDEDDEQPHHAQTATAETSR